jgi:hypothetical protein
MYLLVNDFTINLRVLFYHNIILKFYNEIECFLY